MVLLEETAADAWRALQAAVVSTGAFGVVLGHLRCKDLVELFVALFAVALQTLLELALSLGAAVVLDRVVVGAGYAAHCVLAGENREVPVSWDVVVHIVQEGDLLGRHVLDVGDVIFGLGLDLRLVDLHFGTAQTGACLQRFGGGSKRRRRLEGPAFGVGCLCAQRSTAARTWWWSQSIARLQL
jgi:hypothetical protein